MNNAVQKIEPQPSAIVPINDHAAMMATITRAAADPNVDIEKMERLWAMKERMDARAAEVAYADAFAAMQLELPAIAERGKAEVNGSVRYTFAKWEDINTAIKPVLAKHGFALSFRTDFSAGITVSGVLQHRLGHREETAITLPSDKSGSKNDVQAVASAVSYGKRYTAAALLNLTSHGEDDDAYAAGGGYDATAWYDAIAAAVDMAGLNALAAELKTAPIPKDALRNIRAKWAARAKELKA